MTDLPNANVTLVAEAGARAAGVDYCTVIACVPQNADGEPKLYANWKSILTRHGYAKGIDYAAQHIEETGKPVIFVPVPIDTEGYVASVVNTGHTGTCVVTIAADTGGALEDCDVVVKTLRGGTIEEDLIRLQVSCDGGRQFRTVNLGLENSYTIPHVGLVLSFAAGTLVAGETCLTARSYAPLPDASTAYTLARTGLVAKQLLARSWLVADVVPDETSASAVVTEINAYETANDRFEYARVAAYDRPKARLSTTGGELTFLASADTITRTTGSWIADGCVPDMSVDIAGSVSNDGTHTVVTVTDLVLTLGASPGLVNETIDSDAAGFSIAGELEKSEHVADADAEYAAIDGERRLDIAHGRGFKKSPITGYQLRRPPSWAASVREYQHDPSIPTFQKKRGPLSGWFLEDVNGRLVEHDERVDGGALAARFTCFRTFGNGPNGTFIAKSVTRADSDSPLSLTHNLAVANIACSVTQAETENCIGETLVLKANGRATEDSLSRIKARVDSALERALLRDFEDGPRASNAFYTPSTDDDFSGPDATLTGVVTLILLGTIINIETEVRVNPTTDA